VEAGYDLLHESHCLWVGRVVLPGREGLQVRAGGLRGGLDGLRGLAAFAGAVGGEALIPGGVQRLDLASPRPLPPAARLRDFSARQKRS
jgi:hypothetical protein